MAIGPSGLGKRPRIPRLPVDDTFLCFPQCRCAVFGHLHSSMPYRRDVQRHLERQKVLEGVDRHAV